MNNDEALQALAHLVDTPYEPGVKATISALTGRAAALAEFDRVVARVTAAGRTPP